jgi:two-component sensor histidine kinase
MKFFTPYILTILMVLQSEVNFSQSSDVNYDNEIDSLISNNLFNEAEIKIRHSILSKLDSAHANIGYDFFKLSVISKKKLLYGLALHQADSALMYYSKKEDEHNIARVSLLKGQIFNILENYINAINELKLAETTFFAEDDTLLIGIVKMNFGNIHNNMFNIEESARYYREAIVCFELLNLKNIVANCYNNIGNLYQRSNQLDSAKLYYDKTLKLRLRNKDSKYSLAVIYHNYGNLYLQQKDYYRALVYINKSVKIKSGIKKNVADLKISYLVFGEIYYGLLDFKTAIEYLKKSLLNTEEMYAEHTNDSHLLIAKCYSEIKNYKKATYHFNKYLIINDSIDNRKNLSSLEQQFVRYEIIKDSLSQSELTMYNELSEIEKNNLILESKLIKSKTSFLFISLLLSLGFGVLLIFSFKKRLKQSNSHKKTLENQNEELKRTLISKEEKETLLKEIHHRVKNNLQIINSLIRLQSHYMSPTNFKDRLEDTENRIRCMALVHEKLYNSQDLSKLDSESYIIELAENLKSAYEFDIEVKLEFNIKKIQLSIDTLIPLGLIINEIISNSLKYAFTGLEKGKINITLEQKDNITLTISDNGIGADLSYDELSEDSLGMELIDSLCSQLNGEFNLVTENGFCYTFTFDKFE